MKTNRTIRSILYAQPMDMGGLAIRQPFPSHKAEQIDPFLLLHHADSRVPEHTDVKHAGVGPHPHRGFSPVSFIFKGGVHHRDSRGNDNIVYAGGTQWMNAGMGVIHSERPPENIQETGGRQELIQLWVNSPASHKMDIPDYQPLTAAETPVIVSGDGLATVQVIAGELNGVKGAIRSLSPVNTFTAELKKGAQYRFPVPVSHNAFIYLLDGKLAVTGEGEVEGHYAAIFNNDGEGFEVTALEDTRLFIGTGEPLNEPVASHGPFVMNNQTQLMEAFRDYQMGKMGVLIEE
ncbi:pirin family protein [Sediminibacterium soli]|uniref:pirin family protein n=1 Tax=Sediminibacterium soli TaxID=2698829 RepID=UPI001379F6A5|nr:pirin family protein [Sediminibacterium soli]NCI45071.1 pirin family protein [Sediminibacterium soli]